MQKASIIIIDDHTLVRETWSLILNQHSQFQVIGEVGNAEEGIELAKNLSPDIIIMDINLPGMNGIEATELISKMSPASKILAVSLHIQPSYAKKIMQKGAMGYVTKNSSREEMFEAIEKVNQGQKYICREIKEIISEQLLSNDGGGAGIHSLSDREMEVLKWVKKGLTSKEIAAQLFISSKTVEVHRYNILHKLKLKNRTSLISFIHSHHLELAD